MTAVAKLDLSPKALVGALVATMVVLTAATWFILVAPKHSQVSSLNTQIVAAQDQLTIRKTAAQKAKHVAAEAVRVHRAMPDTVAMPQLVYELSRVAGEVNVSVDSITPAPATAFSGYTEVPIAVIVTGKFFAVEAFLKELRNQVRISSGNIFATGRLFDVQSVSIAQATDKPGISATLNIDAFVYSGQALAPPVPAAGTST